MRVCVCARVARACVCVCARVTCACVRVHAWHVRVCVCVCVCCESNVTRYTHAAERHGIREVSYV